MRTDQAKSWNASSVSSSHGQKCRASIRATQRAAPPVARSSSAPMAAPRIGQFLREDRPIALVRQRLSIPGGCCSFDLPTLHIWLRLVPQAYRDEQVVQLVCQPSIRLVQSLSLDPLDLIRNSALFRKNRPASTAFIRIMAKMPIQLRLRSIWLTSFIRKFPAIRAVSPSVSWGADSEYGSCRERFDLNWPAVKEITCQKRLSSTARPAGKNHCGGASRVRFVRSAASAANWIDLGMGCGKRSASPARGIFR